MPAKSAMPINGAILSWALEQGGYSERAFAKAMTTSASEVTSRDVRKWIEGTVQPSKPELVRIATVLKRPTAVFFMRSTPPDDAQANLREARGASGRALRPAERVDVRWAVRLQQTLASTLKDSEDAVGVPDLKRLSAEQAAQRLRETLERSVEEQCEWKDASQAFHEWRRAIEARGVFVLQFEMGEDGIRGFSVWDPHAPVIAVNNSADATYEARIFSLFHELAHLARRDVAACGRFSPNSESEEYWCDQFASAALLPKTDVQSFASTLKLKDDLALVARVASHFNVSLSATAIRLSDIELVDPSVVSSVFAVVNKRRRKAKGGGGGSSRVESRRRELGAPLLRLFLAERARGRMDELDLADYLRVERADVEELASVLEEPVA